MWMFLTAGLLKCSSSKHEGCVTLSPCPCPCSWAEMWLLQQQKGEPEVRLHAVLPAEQAASCRQRSRLSQLTRSGASAWKRVQEGGRQPPESANRTALLLSGRRSVRMCSGGERGTAVLCRSVPRVLVVLLPAVGSACTALLANVIKAAAQLQPSLSALLPSRLLTGWWSAATRRARSPASDACSARCCGSRGNGWGTTRSRAAAGAARRRGGRASRCSGAGAAGRARGGPCCAAGGGGGGREEEEKEGVRQQLRAAAAAVLGGGGALPRAGWKRRRRGRRWDRPGQLRAGSRPAAPYWEES